MSSLEIVKAIQYSETKEKVREEIRKIAIKFAKQNKTGIQSLSLPSTEWLFEKGLINDCEENNIPVKVMGVENSPQANVFNEFKKNKPAGHFAFKKRIDFNEAIECATRRSFNFIWADYCGNPAEVTYNEETGKYKYCFPNIQTFRKYVENSNKPELYFMTFSCNGRILGGAENMIKTMSPSSTSVQSAIKAKISQLLSVYGLSDKAKPILSIYYHGSGKSFMITLGYAINFTPNFKAVKENWVVANNTKAGKAGKVKKEASFIDIKKEAMTALIDLGWKSAKIAHAFNVKTGTVSGIKAWHKNRASWEKV